MRALFAPLLLMATAAAAQTPLRDTPYPGTMTLNIDATDIDRAIFRVKQSIPVASAGPMTLRFPEWLPGNHAPRGQIEKLGGLKVLAGGKTLLWKRDPLNVFSFTVDVPAGTSKLDLSFEFLSATSEDQGRVVMTPEMMNIQGNSMSLYPAGWKTSRIPVSASITYPAGWKAGTALRPAATNGSTVRYQSVDYETFVDSPIFAGKYFRADDLGSGVTLNIVADDAKNLVIKPVELDAHKALVTQAIKLFGTRQFDHYDFLLALTDKMGGIGLEHHRSSENGVNPEYFTDWAAGPGRRNLLPHELVHSWNGKHRRPNGQMVGDFKTPLINDLMWVYEGQTQFWGYVLGARSGIFSKQDTLDAYASIAAGLDIRRGRDWRSVDDTTNDPVISARRPKGWVTYQRAEDYYNEGLLIWLETDAIIRKQSGGAKGMDDFARKFFGTKDGDFSAKGYDFAEIVATLNGVTPYDWAGFLNTRLTEKASGAPLAGLALGGYKLIYTDTPTAFTKDAEKRAKSVGLSYSLGLTIGKGGKIADIIWDGPAFNAGLTVGAEIIAVDGRSYTDDGLKDAVTTAKNGKDPIRLIIKSGDRVRDIAVQWNGGLRYPRLEKVGLGDGSLDMLLKPRL